MNELRKKANEKLLMASKETEIARRECMRVMEEYEELKTDFEQVLSRKEFQQVKEYQIGGSQVT